MDDLRGVIDLCSLVGATTLAMILLGVMVIFELSPDGKDFIDSLSIMR